MPPSPLLRLARPLRFSSTARSTWGPPKLLSRLLRRVTPMGLRRLPLSAPLERPFALPPLCRIAALLVGLFFPTLESMKAIESKQLGDDTQVGV